MERGCRARLDIADHHAVGMRGEQELHDAQSRFRAHGGEHIGISRDLFRIGFPCHEILALYISRYIEIWEECQGAAKVDRIPSQSNLSFHSFALGYRVGHPTVLPATQTLPFGAIAG